MTNVYWDCETYSLCALNERGAHIYAGDPTTNFHFFCYAIADGEVETWKPGDPVPAPFANPTEYKFVADNWEFERAIHARILVERYGFPPLPIENQDCAQRLALSGTRAALRSSRPAVPQGSRGAQGDASLVASRDRKESKEARRPCRP